MADVSGLSFVNWIVMPVEAAKPRLKTPARLSIRLTKTLLTYNL